MKKFFANLRLENLIRELSRILVRFPISLGLIVGLCIILLVLVYVDQNVSYISDLWKAALSIIITFFLGLGVYLYSEIENYSKLKRDIFQAFPLVFGILFFFSFSSNIDSVENIMRFIVTLFGILGFLFFAPFVRDIYTRKIPQDSYYNYFYNISVVFLLSFIFGGFTLVLGYIGISATISLFDLNFGSSGKLFGDWAIFSLAFAAPLFGLTQIPKKEELRKNDFHENIFFSFLIKFVALPSIFVYFIILYAYTFKVLLNFGDWPKGEVVWLVIGFSTFGYAVYIFSYIFEQKIHIVELFRKYFPYAVIPQTIMLFYAIYLRINQYDITSNRYFVVVFGLWLILVSLYLIFSRRKFLAIIPALLTLFTLLISIGPWGVFSLPAKRQLARLEKNLEIANILKDGEITPLESYNSIDPKLSGDIYSGIQYVCGFDDCKKIQELFPTLYSEIRTEYQEDMKQYNYTGTYAEMYAEPSQWEITDRLSKKLKVEMYYDGKIENSTQKYIYLYYDSKGEMYPLDISGYDLLTQFGVGNSNISYDSIAKTITLKQEGRDEEIFDISAFMESLYEKYQATNDAALSREDMTLELSGENHDIKIYLDSISVENPNYTGTENQDYYDRGIYGSVLIKNK